MNTRSAIYWFIWLATVFVAVGLCVHLASGQPSPPMPSAKMKVKRVEPLTTQGAGALALISKPKALTAPILRTNVIAWKYPSSINPNDYYWNVMVRENGQLSWSVAISNSTEGNDLVFVNKLTSKAEYRLEGRLNP